MNDDIIEAGSINSNPYENDEEVPAPQNESTPMSFYFTRAAIIYFVYFLSFVIPNINIMLILGGSILGTIVTIIIPVMFYNRAYSNEDKHLGLDKNVSADLKDNRKIIKVLNAIVLVVGITIGTFGFVKAVQEVMKGEARADA